MNISTEGIEELIYGIMQAISNFDLKALDSEFFAGILDKIYPLWNPIWKLVNEFLFSKFGF